jgi:pimeloyl-ACP methyl ester carboxylesterase
MKRLGRTGAFRAPDGRLVPRSIAEVAYLRLGGVDQWVMMRGESLDNPPLIFLHGGPGLSETAFLRYFNTPLERSFTVVYWDQRGTGRSFDRDIPRSSMTVSQFMTDLDELVDAVCKRLGKTKVVIFGHSWGSALGVLYAARFPQKVSLYVGGAQIGDWPAAELQSYAFGLAEAKRMGNENILRKLRAIGPPPYSADSVFTERTCVMRLEGRMSAKEMWKTGRAVLASPESSVLDLVGTMRGFRFSMNAMWPEVSRLNLIQLAPSLQVPVFMFLGRNDHWVPPETSMAYIEALKAPSKEVLWFEESGHEMFVDEPGRFNDAMTSRVRPACPVDSPEPAAPPRHPLPGPRVERA